MILIVNYHNLVLINLKKHITNSINVLIISHAFSIKTVKLIHVMLLQYHYLYDITEMLRFI